MMQEQKSVGKSGKPLQKRSEALRKRLAGFKDKLAAAGSGVDARQIGRFLFAAGASFLLAQCGLPFGAYPFGIAFLAAIPGNLLPALLGICAAAMFTGVHPAIYMTVAVAAALIRSVGKLLAGQADDLPVAGTVPPDRKLTVREQFRAVLRIGLPGVNGTVADANENRQAVGQVSGQASGQTDGKETGQAGKRVPVHTAEKTGERAAGPSAAMNETAFASGKTARAAASAAGTVSSGDTIADSRQDTGAEPLALRVVCAAVAATAAGVCICVAGGFRVYDLIGMGISVAAATLAVPVFACVADPDTRRMIPGKIASAVLIFLLLFAARGLHFLGISVGVAAGFFLTAEAVRRRGVIVGLLASVIAGLAYSPAMTPAFILGAIAVALLGGVSRTVALVVAAAATACGGALVGGIGGVLTVLPGALAGAVLSETSVRVTAARRKKQEQSESESAAGMGETLARLCRGDAMESRLRDLSGAFSSLSEMFFNLSDRIRRPALLDLRHACDSIMEKNCDGCPDRDICWGLSYEQTMDALGKLTSSLYTKGVADTERIDPELLARCRRMDVILSEMNETCARMTGEALRGCRTEIFAWDYEALAGILAEALENDRQSYECDQAMGARIASALSDAGLRVDGVAAFGGGRRRVLARGVDLLHAGADAKAVQSAVEKACGIRMSRPVFEVSDGESVMYMNARRRFSVRHAERTLPAGGEGTVCGDSVSAFAGKDDRFCALICDGMGRGREAALTSGVSSVFLEKMLSAGNRAATSVRMLNTFVRSGGTCVGECSATVDLCEIDLFTGSASFLKSGAAPSFVIRAGKVFRLESKTLPVGILGSVDAQVTRFDLLAGDIIVMVSDGVSDALGDRLTDLLKTLTADPDRSAEEILATVKAIPDNSPDDLSVVVLAVIPAAEEEQ